MPCRDGGPAVDYVVQQQDMIHKLTKLLCESCKELKKARRLDQCSKELKSWNEMHETQDRARKEQEKLKTEMMLAKSNALAKLTLYEKKLLGIQ